MFLVFRKFSSQIANKVFKDRSILSNMLKKYKFDSEPVKNFVSQIYATHEKDLLFYNNLLTVYVRNKVSPVHIENLINEMKSLKLEPDNYIKHTLLFHFCLNKNMEKAEAIANAIPTLNTTGNQLTVH